MKLTNNTILITGGTSGIGYAFAERFYKLGNKVIVCGRREERLKELEVKFPGMVARKCHMENEAERADFALWVLKEFPEVNVLINNAGIQLITDLTKPLDLHRTHSEIETNIVAPMHITSLFAEHLKTKSAAAIINISSGLSFVPIAHVAFYCATKAALHSLTLSLRYQLRGTSVSVFEVIPPQVDTELGADLRGGQAGTHGGMPIADFLEEAMTGIENDMLETAVGGAKNLREKREAAFGFMNPA